MIRKVEALLLEEFLDAICVPLDVLVQVTILGVVSVEGHKLDFFQQVNIRPARHHRHRLLLFDKYNKNLVADINNSETSKALNPQRSLIIVRFTNFKKLV